MMARPAGFHRETIERMRTRQARSREAWTVFGREDGLRSLPIAKGEAHAESVGGEAAVVAYREGWHEGRGSVLTVNEAVLVQLAASVAALERAEKARQAMRARLGAGGRGRRTKGAALSPVSVVAARESVQAKAHRYLTEGRLRVRLVDEDAGIVEADCRGSGSVYALGRDEGGWFCGCPARGRSCAHLEALRLVVAVEPREMLR